MHRHPVAAYFALTFAISWMAAAAVAAPHLLRHEELPRLTGILMFPAMLLGPSITGIALTAYLDGKAGLKELYRRMAWGHVPGRWFAPLLIPPVLVLTVLACLYAFVSPAYTPNHFWIGMMFGVPAGLLEEIGWTGFAFARMRQVGRNKSALGQAILIGVIWSAWHLPVINFLGSAVPHGRSWLAFFAAFTTAMTAIRVLICWMYANTGSVWLAQLMHISSTGSLVVFGALRVTSAQEAFWYGAYGLVLWVVVGVVSLRFFTASLRESDSPWGH